MRDTPAAPGAVDDVVVPDPTTDGPLQGSRRGFGGRAGLVGRVHCASWPEVFLPHRRIQPEVRVDGTRHPQEQDRHRVNAVDGSWEGNALYMPDGTELRFTAGMTLELEISAPGYTTQVFQYQVRKRKNTVQVSLPKIESEATPVEEPVISFGRDETRETTE